MILSDVKGDISVQISMYSGNQSWINEIKLFHLQVKDIYYLSSIIKILIK